jgi:hypothetical protein
MGDLVSLRKAVPRLIKDHVDGAAHTSENEERKDGDADQRGDIESADRSDQEKDISTSEHKNRDSGVC